MQTLNLPKVDGVSTEPAAEYNSFGYELQNIITGSGQTLSGGDLNQLGKAIAVYASCGDYYVDSGAANAYVVDPISSKQAPNAYRDGMRVRFLPANPNNGASTINVNSLGLKDIRLNAAGTALPGGYLRQNVETSLTYIVSLGYFIISPFATIGQFSQVSFGASSFQTITPSNVPSIVNFDTVNDDLMGWWNVGGKRFIPPAGRYIASSVIQYEGPTPDENQFSLLMKNGSEHKTFDIDCLSAAVSQSLSGSLPFRANGTDYFQLGYINSASSAADATVGTVTNAAGLLCSFSIVCIGV